MQQRWVFLIAILICAVALVAATATAPLPTGDAAASWRTEHVRATRQRPDYWMAYVALGGKDQRSGGDTLARAEIVCQTDSGARILIGILPERPPSDTAIGQASFFTTVRARVVSMRPFARFRGAASKLEGDWPYRRMNNGRGYLVIRTGEPVRRLAREMRDDRLLSVQFADGRLFEFPLRGADTATASVLARCIDS